MDRLTHEEIPDGSFALRVFADGAVPDQSPIETVLVLFNRGEGACEVGLAHGHLSAETNILIGLKAIELGFTTLKFKVLKGSRHTRLATKVRECENFEYYEVDLHRVHKDLGL